MSEKISDLLNINMDTADDETIFALCDKFKEDGLSDDRQFRDRAVNGSNFYHGYQWDSGTLEILRQKGLPALTFNIVKKIVEYLVGTQTQNRKDINVSPTRNASSAISTILTYIVKDIITNNKGQHLMSEWMRQGCIAGRSFMHCWRDYQDDPWNGDIKMEVVKALDAVVDPNSQMYDLSDSKYFIIFKYENKDFILEQYPEKAEILRDINGDWDASTKSQDVFSADFGNNGDDARVANESRYNNRGEYRYKVQWTYIKKYISRKHLVDKEELTDFILKDKEAIDIGEGLEQENPERYKVVSRVDNVLYLIKNIDSVILERVKEPFNNKGEEGEDKNIYINPTSLYPVIPFGANFDSGTWTGIIDDLVDPQMEKNKLRSSLLHIVSSSSNSGWVFAKGSLDADTKENLKTSGASTGINIEYDVEASGANPPQRIMPNAFPQGIKLLAEQSNIDINEISGVNAANLGMTTSQESGKLNELRQIQGLTTNTGVYDNFDHSMKILGQFLIEVVRSTDIYTIKEIEEVMDNNQMFDKNIIAEATAIVNKQFPLPNIEQFMSQVDPNDQEAVQKIQAAFKELELLRQKHIQGVGKEIIMSQLKNLYKGKYSVAVTQSNFSPTLRQSNMLRVFEIDQRYPGLIPPSYLIDQTDIPDKAEVIAQIEQRQAAAAQAQAQAAQQDTMSKIAVEKIKNQGKMEQEAMKQKGSLAQSAIESQKQQ